MKFYAEFDTDKIIRETFFPDYNYKGVMVEVGGATPEFLSMSKHYKDSGWRVIIIEPNPEYVELHKKIGNEVYEYACSDENSHSEFTIVQQNKMAYGGLITEQSFSSLKIDEEYLNKTGIDINSLYTKIIKVETKKLDSILEELKINVIDILSIDVEGWELNVMKGLDTKKINCDVIVIENFLNNPDYLKYFESIGYTLVKEINYNQIYKKK